MRIWGGSRRDLNPIQEGRVKSRSQENVHPKMAARFTPCENKKETVKEGSKRTLKENGGERAGFLAIRTFLSERASETGDGGSSSV